MHAERTKDRGGALVAVAALAAALLASVPAAAAPGDAQGARGMVFARKRDCVKAIPLLEEAEKLRHRPSTAVALADCYVATGELLRAAEILHQVSDEQKQRFWVRADYNASKAAKKKAADVDARIPTIRFDAPDSYDDLEVEIDGNAVADPSVEKQVAPDVTVNIAARAKGRKDFADKVTLNEGERRVIVLRLPPTVEPKKKKVVLPREPAPTSWLGVRYYGVIIPKFVMNFVADGGRNLVVPGGAFTFTTQASDAEVTVGLGYLSYRMGDTPFKPHGEPDTEWEITSSTLQAITATVDLMWSFPLDTARQVNFRIGGSAGFGWMFLGDLSRIQSYPADLMPGDPSTYLKCKGPNNPLGTFRYCNALDKDAQHYPGFSEPDWFHHGVRPLIFPWLVLPQLGLSFRPARGVAIDIDTGVSISGILTSAGVRFGL
jgi:hypothetical protein